jgi:hypothetical protein
VLAADDVSQAFNGVGQIHDLAILAGRVGQRLSKVPFQYTNRDLDIRTVSGWEPRNRSDFNIRTGTSIYEPSLDVIWTVGLPIKGLHFACQGIKLVQYTNQRRTTIVANY